jgi:hypothetical protein
MKQRPKHFNASYVLNSSTMAATYNVTLGNSKGFPVLYFEECQKKQGLEEHVL